MANYLEVINDKNSIVVNDEFQNFHFEKLLVFTSKDVNGLYINDLVPSETTAYLIKNSGYMLFNIPLQNGELVAFSSNEPLLVVTGTHFLNRAEVKVHFGKLVEKLRNDGISSSEIIKKSTQLILSGVKVYKFTTAHSDSNSGFCAYNERGEVVFNANNRYMKVVDVMHDYNHTTYNLHNHGGFGAYEEYQKGYKREYKNNIAIIPFAFPTYENHMAQMSERWTKGIAFDGEQKISLTAIDVHHFFSEIYDTRVNKSLAFIVVEAPKVTL